MNTLSRSLFALTLLSLLIGCQPPAENELNTGSTPVANPTNSRGKSLFTVGVDQQDARGVWQRQIIQKGKVTLESKPFKIIFFSKSKDATPLLVQASTSPAIIQAASQGTVLSALLPANAEIAEPMENPKQKLYLSDGAYQSWMYAGPKAHRFDPDGIKSLAESGWILKRTIANIVMGNTVTPISNFTGKKIYLLIAQADKNPQTGKLTEQQIDWLTLEFPNAPTSNPAE